MVGSRSDNYLTKRNRLDNTQFQIPKLSDLSAHCLKNNRTRLTRCLKLKSYSSTSSEGSLDEATNEHDHAKRIAGFDELEVSKRG
jgi:hypothetical protein